MKFIYVISPSAVSIMINHKTISVPKKDYRYTSIVEMCKRQDIDSLMKLIIKKVKEDSGFVLEPEVIRIGRF